MRIRALKPDFWKSETVGQVSRDARLLFMGLWGMSDAWGVVEDRPRRIRVELFPYDELVADQVVGWIDELVSAHLVVRYEGRQGGKGVALLWLPGLRRHQIGSMPKEERERGPKHPLPPGVTPENIMSGVAAVSINASDDSYDRTPPLQVGGERVVPQRVTGDGYTGDGRAGGRERPSAATQRTSPPIDANDPHARWSYERLRPWVATLSAVPGIRGLDVNGYTQWKTLVDEHGADVVASAAKRCDPKFRYADRAEEVIAAHAPPPPEPEDAELDAVRGLIDRHGWQACLAVVGFGNVKSAEVLVRALDGNRPACRQLIGHYDCGGAAAGAGAA